MLRFMILLIIVTLLFAFCLHGNLKRLERKPIQKDKILYWRSEGPYAPF